MAESRIISRRSPIFLPEVSAFEISQSSISSFMWVPRRSSSMRERTAVRALCNVFSE
jgi:hypothetical protein